MTLRVHNGGPGSIDYTRLIQYSAKYYDDTYEYRHVIVPRELIARIPKGKLMSEYQWRSLGVQQSRGWVHYAIHNPERHILLFRRPKGFDPTTVLMNDALVGNTIAHTHVIRVEHKGEKKGETGMVTRARKKATERGC